MKFASPLFVSIFLKYIQSVNCCYSSSLETSIQNTEFSNRGVSFFKMLSLSLVNVFETAELLSLSVFDPLVSLQNDSYSKFL
jgi:hypothetical protein